MATDCGASRHVTPRDLVHRWTRGARRLEAVLITVDRRPITVILNTVHRVRVAHAVVEANRR
jgi:hypothetical protein